VLRAAFLEGIATSLVVALITELAARFGRERRVPRWFGFIKLTYVRTATAGIFTLTAAAGITLSISDHSHHTISYVGWYGGAVIALAVVVATTVIIDRKPPASESYVSAPSPAMPERAPVSQKHEQQLHEWLTLLTRTVEQGSSSGFVGYPEGAGQLQSALIMHFPDLLARLSEWDQAVARNLAAPAEAQEQIERAVLADPGIPDGYDRQSVAASIAGLVVAIGGSYRFVIRTLGNGVQGSDTYWSVHIARDARNEVQVASLPDIPIDRHLELVGRHEAALQAVVEHAARSDRLPEIAAARAALEALKQPLLDLLAIKSTVSPVLSIADCPFCQAQLQMDAAPTAAAPQPTL
jgi:hypothetical protein